MPTTPDVFVRLKRCGIRQQDIAETFGIPKSSVSQWKNGVRAIPRHYMPDLEALAALAQTAVAEGRSGREALRTVQPHARTASSGDVTLGASSGPIPPEIQDALAQIWQRARQEETHTWHEATLVMLVHGVRRIAASRLAAGPVFPLAIPADEIEELREAALFLLLQCESAQHEISQHGPLPPIPEETPACTAS
jgi:transcriptional regulator with XRE-family HTH domain